MASAIALLGEYTPTFPPLAATESYYCDFGVNPDYVDELRRGPLRISGADDEGEIRVIEYPGHPFCIGTLFVPQARSRPAAPHPLITAFLRAVIDHAAQSGRFVPSPRGRGGTRMARPPCYATPVKENTP